MTKAPNTADLPEPADKTAYVRQMFDTIAPRYDLLNRVMALGLDRSWRRRAIRQLDLFPGSIVVDLACGTGDLANELQAESYRAIGVDLSEQMLRRAHVRGAPLAQCDAEDLGLKTAAVDGVVSGFAVRNFTDLSAVLEEIARILRPGGRVSLLDVDIPQNCLVALGHHLWFDLAAPRIGAVFSNAEAYRYLPRSVVYLPNEESIRTIFERSGFREIKKQSLFFGTVQILTATRLGALPLGVKRTDAQRSSQ